MNNNLKAIPRYSKEEIEAMRSRALETKVCIKADRRPVEQVSVSHSKIQPKYSKTELAQMRCKAQGKEYAPIKPRYTKEDIEKMRNAAMSK